VHAVPVLLLLAATTAVVHAQPPAGTRIAGSNVAWELDPRTARVDDHLGRRALFLRGQLPMTFAAGVDFTDGTIEFDIAPMTGANFVGLVFRYETPTIHDNIYFRLHKSGEFDAVQYAPRLHTTAGAWQLFREFAGPGELPGGAWTHVRVEVRGSRLEIFVGDSTKPLVVVPRMRGLSARGKVGFWGRINNQPTDWTAALSNMQVRTRAPEGVALPDTLALPSGTLTGWQVAGPYEAPDSTVAPPFPALGAWKPIAIEEDGLLNISRNVAKPPGGRHVVFLRTTIRSTSARSAPLTIGYSEDVMLWLNGAPVYRGTNAFNGRYPGYNGWLSLAETVYLPLTSGDNQLLVAVGERGFGWGLKARISQ
jgi:hypothetical protein